MRDLVKRRLCQKARAGLSGALTSPSVTEAAVQGLHLNGEGLGAQKVTEQDLSLGFWPPSLMWGGQGGTGPSLRGLDMTRAPSPKIAKLCLTPLRPEPQVRTCCLVTENAHRAGPEGPTWFGLSSAISPTTRLSISFTRSRPCILV